MRRRRWAEGEEDGGYGGDETTYGDADEEDATEGACDYDEESEYEDEDGLILIRLFLLPGQYPPAQQEKARLSVYWAGVRSKIGMSGFVRSMGRAKASRPVSGLAPLEYFPPRLFVMLELGRGRT